MDEKTNVKGDPVAERIVGILLGISASIKEADPESMDLSELHYLIDRIDRSILQARQHLEASPDY